VLALACFKTQITGNTNMTQHRRRFHSDHVIHATGMIQHNGTLNPFRPGCGAHERTEILRLRADGMTVAEYKAKFVTTRKTKATTLATCTREGVVEVRPPASLPVVYDSNGRARGGATFGCPNCHGITRARPAK
jgi:hypothetical protein